MAFKRVHFRAEFDKDLTNAEIATFIDTFFGRCKVAQLNGLIVEHKGILTVILEGNDTPLDAEITFLSGADELESSNPYHVEGSTPWYTCLSSSLTADARNEHC